MLPAAYPLAYCTNVHAGADLASTRKNLEKYALAVKAIVSPDAPMGLGLWLSASAARQMMETDQVEPFARWLAQVGLLPFTLNGFPHGDFHQAIVKHRVYEPTWWEKDRLEYTRQLIDIQHRILPPGLEGSISTLPIAWGTPRPDEYQLQLAAANLRELAWYLSDLEKNTGRLIYLCIEPEPGCFIQRKEDVLHYFQNFLFLRGRNQHLGRYLRVCHDVCHSVVMFESQEEVLKAYHDAGILVGKVQVSSAVRAVFEEMAPEHRAGAIHYLGSFAEDRFLHQTMIQEGASRPLFFEDLPAALKMVEDPESLVSEWRTHFHVPIYLERFGPLLASREEIDECLRALRVYSEVQHLEVETYAWSVLPRELRQPDLAAGIAEEMNWLRDQLLQSRTRNDAE